MNKDVFRYIFLAFIVYVMAFIVIFVSNNLSLNANNKRIKDNLISNEARKIDDDYFWIYPYPSNNKNIIVPYFNIDNTNIAKINKQNVNENLENVKNASYLYSINGDLLSLMYKIEYSDSILYRIYNFNLGTNKIIKSSELFDYLDINSDETVNYIVESVKTYIRNFKYDNNLEDEYTLNTLAKLYEEISEDNLKIFVGSNKELNVVITIYHEVNEPILITVIDK